MYHVVNWDTNETLSTFDSLSKAKRVCKKLGHTNDPPWAGTYAPVAYVADDNGWLVYNPRFRAD